MNSIKKTILYNEHIKLEAKVLPYAGYLMPINYPKGIKHEYLAIRKKVGIFDVSHMGEIKIKGDKSFDLLQLLTSNDVAKLKEGDAQYSLICNHNGGIMDDVIIYKININEYLLIVNASNCLKIFNWINENNKFEVFVTNETDKYSLIAIQGPKSRELLNDVFKQEIKLKFYKHQFIEYQAENLLISRTGYTGELGFEILIDNNFIISLWNEIINKGAIPCGLAVRDILRMEMKYCLYGNDIDEKTTPIEAGLNWVVSSKDKFIGKDKIRMQETRGVNKKLKPFILKDRGIPRKGYKIYNKEKEIGVVTSGTFSIGLNYGIGIGYIDSECENENIFIDIRNKKYLAEVVKPPFIKNYSLHK